MIYNKNILILWIYIKSSGLKGRPSTVTEKRHEAKKFETCVGFKQRIQATNGVKTRMN